MRQTKDVSLLNLISFIFKTVKFYIMFSFNLNFFANTIFHKLKNINTNVFFFKKYIFIYDLNACFGFWALI